MLLMRHNRQTKTRKKIQIHGILLVKSKIKPTEKKDSSPNSPIHTLLMTSFPFATQLTTLEFSSSEEFIFSVITLVGLIGNVCEMCVLSCLRRLA